MPKSLMKHLAITALLLTLSITTVQAAFPSIHLTTDPEVWQDRETWFAGTVAIEHPTHPDWNTALTPADVRGRGNSTWNRGEDKRPLRFRFPEPQSVLHYTHEARTWVTFANLFDKSLLRNHAVFTLGQQMSGLEWTPVSQFVHMYVNGEYMGVYQLTDERDINAGRLNITVDVDPAVSEFVIERDARVSRDASNILGLHWVTYNGLNYEIRFPSGALRTAAHGAYVEDFIRNTSDAIRSMDWDTIVQWIDVPSFVDFYIAQEIARNVDIGFSSVFMQIRGQGEDRRLVKGPLWDFDISLGNQTRNLADRPMAARRNYWFVYLMQVPQFQQAVAERWPDVRDTYIPYVIADIQRIAETYAADFERNFQRHPILGTEVWMNHALTLELHTHQAHVDRLITFLEDITVWFDGWLPRVMAGEFEIVNEDTRFNTYMDAKEIYSDSGESAVLSAEIE